LWEAAGFNYTKLCEEPWYISGGGKMGETLLKAEQLSLYTLSDIGTYTKYSKDGIIHLATFVTGERELLNVYSVIVANQTRHTHVNFDDAINFTKFLVSEECQQLIENYGKDEYGQNLFHGAVQVLKQNSSSKIAQWIRDCAFFNGSECPPEYRDGHPELYD
jgi:tungstate transport system substrate-binding protein